MNEGWVAAYRKIEENPIVCKDNDYFRVWHYLLYNATHREKEIIFGTKKIMLKPGQLVTGREAISNKCKVQSSKVVRILKVFKNEHQIEQQTCTKGTLITIVNWDKYQNNKHQNEQQMNNERTTSEQQMNTNNNVTMKQCNNETNNNIVTTTNTHAISKNLKLFSYLESVFGRTLSGSEYEKIVLWEDNELTRYAIKQAELARAFNVKYIERILQSYKRDHIKTVIEAEERDRRYQEQKKEKKTQRGTYLSKEEQYRLEDQKLREKFRKEDEENAKRASV